MDGRCDIVLYNPQAYMLVLNLRMIVAILKKGKNFLKKAKLFTVFQIIA